MYLPNTNNWKIVALFGNGHMMNEKIHLHRKLKVEVTRVLHVGLGSDMKKTDLWTIHLIMEQAFLSNNSTKTEKKCMQR